MNQRPFVATFAIILVIGMVLIAVSSYRARLQQSSSATQEDSSALVTDDAAGQVFSEDIMSTAITVRLYPHHGENKARLVFDVFNDIDARMSEWKATSPLSAVNQAAGREAITVPDDLRALLQRGIAIGDETNGAFDITWAALWGLWDFRVDATPQVPADDDIAARIEQIDYQAVQIDDEAGTVFLPHEGMLIGLGGIAKGYALDLAADALRAQGINNFLIAAGGQMMVGGKKDDNRLWRVGIRDPRGEPDDYFAHIECSDVSVSTSGDYERYFVIDGIRYHHILDPRTGRPARAGVRSATVVSPDATLADALSTALVIMGTERAMDLVERLPDVEAVLVDDEAQVHVSTGLEGRLHFRHPPTP